MSKAFLLFSLLLLPASTSKSFGQPPDLPASPETPGQNVPEIDKPKIIELSVNGDVRTTALVVWHLKNGDLKATQIEKKFSFEWLRIPDDAESFLVTPDLVDRKFDTTDFIELSKLPGSNIYVSLRVVGGGISFTRIDNKSFSQNPTSVRNEPRLTSVEEGWVYIGSWDNNSMQWNTVYWLDTPADEVMSKRRRLSTAPPEELKGKSAVLDFPLAYRKGPSTKFEQIQSGRFLSPGSVYEIQEVSRIPYPSHHEIWAKIKTSQPTTPSP